MQLVDHVLLNTRDELLCDSVTKLDTERGRGNFFYLLYAVPWLLPMEGGLWVSGTLYCLLLRVADLA